MTADDSDPSGNVEVGLAALLEGRDDFDHQALASTAVRARRRRASIPARPSTPFWLVGFPALMAVLALAAVVLFRAGWDDVRLSRGGTVVNPTLSRTEPGWQAQTESTPTLLVIQTDGEGRATGFAVLSLSGEKVGGVIVIPPNAALPIPGVGPIRFDEAFAKNREAGAKAAIEYLLGAGLADVTIIDPATWAGLVQPSAPVVVDNRDAVKIDGKVAYPTGKVSLGAGDVARFLSAGVVGEADVNRLLRNEVFWKAWLARVAESGTADALPGEVGTGIGRFVRALATRKVDVRQLPSKPVGVGESTHFSADDLAVAALVGRLIPFPVSPVPGLRLRIRILDGTGKFDHGTVLAATLVQAGSELTAIGNAKSFDITTTELVYYDDAYADRVKKLADVMGVGHVAKSAAVAQGADVDVILGADAAPLMGRLGQPVATNPAATGTTTTLGGTGG